MIGIGRCLLTGIRDEKSKRRNDSNERIASRPNSSWGRTAMKVGDKLKLYSHSGYRHEVTITSLSEIDRLTGRPCFACAWDAWKYEAKFYSEAENGKHFNVGNKAFWVVK